MIQDEKDRLDILRIAVTLTIPKASTMPAAQLGAHVVELAQTLENFVKEKKDGR